MKMSNRWECWRQKLLCNIHTLILLYYQFTHRNGAGLGEIAEILNRLFLSNGRCVCEKQCLITSLIVVWAANKQIQIQPLIQDRIKYSERISSKDICQRNTLYRFYGKWKGNNTIHIHGYHNLKTNLAPAMRGNGAHQEHPHLE